MKYSYDSPYCHDDTSHQRISSKHFLGLQFFYLNSQTVGYHPQTQKLEPPCTA